MRAKAGWGTNSVNSGDGAVKHPGLLGNPLPHLKVWPPTLAPHGMPGPEQVLSEQVLHCGNLLPQFTDFSLPRNNLKNYCSFEKKA